MHMVSRDRTRWIVASKVPDIFRSDGSVNAEPLALAPTIDEWERQFDLDEPTADLRAFSVAGITGVRAEWVLVPAWIVIAIAALLPTAREAAGSLSPWNLIQLNGAFGWRGVMLGVLWLVMLLIAATALALSTLARGKRRAVGGLVTGLLAVLLCAVVLWAGTGSGFITGMTVLLVVFAVRVLDAILYGPSSLTARTSEPAITLSETGVGFSVAVAALLVAIVGVVVKGIPFSVAAFFVLVASGACSVAAVLAGGESPKRGLILWMSLLTILAVVLAVVAESITAHMLGAPRMAIVEGVRALCVTALASICAYVSYCELRFIQPRSNSALDPTAHNSEELAP